MPVKSISELMKELKTCYDKSNNKETWHILQGRSARYNELFISGDGCLWQIKAKDVAKNEQMAVGGKVGRIDEELESIMKTGTPVPFGTITPQKKSPAILMVGMQMYSSDAAFKICKDHVSNKQHALEKKLDSELERMQKSPDFRKRYRDFRDDYAKTYL